MDLILHFHHSRVDWSRQSVSKFYPKYHFERISNEENFFISDINCVDAISTGICTFLGHL